ncbi:MAG TPA: heat-inducible transcriptional repressor HrcA [Candidatus Limnocylindrales bacterium]|nr:heat-inducible transcriptional repressor HrcA [Candidatus Limnocylindrales bacterium]
MSPTILQQKRHQQILTDVVREYIETGEPVSSRSIARRHAEPLSPATVRNVMADLEDEGYLYQPHTSAGRVPTASAYKFFVEQVANQATASPQDRQWIRRELESADTPEAIMERASHVLSAVSRGLGIFISPPLARSVVEHMRFLLLPDSRILVVLITAGGMTRDKVVRTERSFRQEDLDHIAEHLNRHYKGWTLEAMRTDLRKQVEHDREQYGRIAGDALTLCDPVMQADTADRKIYVEGAAQIAASAEFTNQEQLRELLSAIEEKDRLIALLSGCIESPEPVHVELGVEQMSAAGKHLALVSSTYTSKDQSQGTLGILAPMRMHYERVITAVAFMAQFFSDNEQWS